MDETKLMQEALEYHRHPTPGKIEVKITTPADSAHDLSLAYSPGVAAPVKAIHEDPMKAYEYTAKGNLIAVISNGTAILGLGRLGALASKPVMEGKALLFKRFANIDAIDIEVDTEDADEFVEVVSRIACSFGGINLEDIASPECFDIEPRLIEKCDIPVFHDDQHGTAIVTTAGILNALELQKKRIDQIRVVCLGAGAAAFSCVRFLCEFGANPEEILTVDRQGVIHTDRDNLNPQKALLARDTPLRTLEEAIAGADVFLGLSGANLLSADNLRKMGANPIVFACSNPSPEIDPEVALATRSDLVMGTGRSDYPNQVNNVLAFPFIFRGALDAHAHTINMPMKLAAAKALSELARQDVPADVLAGYDEKQLAFGPDYILPKPTDPRLLTEVAGAVCRAAGETGTARRKDMPR